MKKTADSKLLAREADLWKRIKEGLKDPGAACRK